MYNNLYQSHLDEEVYSADPVRLVCLLYRKLRSDIIAARRACRESDPAARARHISSAMAVVAELSASLDSTHTGELPARLAAIYDFMAYQLAESHTTQREQPLIDVERVLGPLEAAWLTLQASRTPPLEAAIPA